jgi:hypothetical protein
MTELIGEGEGRRLLADCQANWRSSAVVSAWAFLPAGYYEESDEEKEANHKFHICSRFDFVPLALQANLPSLNQNS